MGTPYSDIKIIVSQAVNIASDLFGIKGGALALVGDVDFNFRIESLSRHADAIHAAGENHARQRNHHSRLIPRFDVHNETGHQQQR